MARTIAMAGFALLGFCAAGTAQVSVQHRLPNGTVVDMGTVTPSGQGEQERQRRQRRCEEELTVAAKALGEKEWYKAWESLKMAAAVAVDQGQADRVSQLLGQLEAAGQELIRQADGARKAGQFPDALDQYGQVSRRFGGLPCAAAARGAIKDLESDPVAQEVLQESKAAVLDKLIAQTLATYYGAAEANAPSPPPAATQPSDRARMVKALPPEQADSVVTRLEQIVRAFPLCPTGRRAKADLESLSADEEFQASLKRFRDGRAARGLLQRAAAFRSAGLLDKAAQDYREVIRLYPDTPEAQQARQALGGGAVP